MPRKIVNKCFEDARKWQVECREAALNKYINLHEKNFLCVGAPGAGKTKLALMIAHELFDKNLIDRLVTVTPTSELTEQWAGEASLGHCQRSEGLHAEWFRPDNCARRLRRSSEQHVLTVDLASHLLDDLDDHRCE